jgi:hypothetical protein
VWHIIDIFINIFSSSSSRGCEIVEKPRKTADRVENGWGKFGGLLSNNLAFSHIIHKRIKIRRNLSTEFTRKTQDIHYLMWKIVIPL